MHHRINHRVQRGAQMLDRQFPGWERYINSGTLNLSNDDLCVLGQLAKRDHRAGNLVIRTCRNKFYRDDILFKLDYWSLSMALVMLMYPKVQYGTLRFAIRCFRFSMQHGFVTLATSRRERDWRLLIAQRRAAHIQEQRVSLPPNRYLEMR